MAYRLTLLAAIVLAFAGSVLAARRLEHSSRVEYCPQWECCRIVAMSPSIVETLYALGLGDRLVGVTRDCQYPPEVEEIKKHGCVGGYYDPNIEATLALRPDLVIMLEEQAASMPNFESLNLETLVVSHKTVEGVIESFRTIGRACGRGKEGRAMASGFRARLDAIQAKTRSLPRPRVLFALDRTFGCGHLSDLYVAADDGYIDTLITLAGGENAYRQPGARYPVVSTEGILSVNPDVIIDMSPPSVVQKFGRPAILADWNDVQQTKAVRNHRVYIFDQTFAYVPGPRFLQFVEYLARELHPEINWDKE